MSTTSQATSVVTSSARHLHRVVLVKNPKHKRDGFKSYIYALQKYGIAPTKDGPYYAANVSKPQGKFQAVKNRIFGTTSPDQQVLMKKRDDPSKEHHHSHHHDHPHEQIHQNTVGTVDASDVQHDAEYLCPVQIGSPAQTLMLDFDTGSADLWVWSTELPQSVLSQYGSNHKIFNPSNSSSFKDDQGYTWKIQYGDSSTASGTVGNDDISLGGLTVENQAVELATNMSSQFQQGAGDGLLGLAFSQINTVKPKQVATPVNNMITQQDIGKNSSLFTAYLGSWKDSNEPDKGESFYTFGYIDQDVLKDLGKTESDIHYAPVDNSNGFWEFPSNSVSVNGHSISVGQNNTAIADTGTTLALVSDQACEAIYRQIPGATYSYRMQGYLFPSHVTANQLPQVMFDVGGKMFAVQKEDLVFTDAGNGYVYGGIQSRGNMPLDILGDTFLKGIYAVFDQGNMRFGAIQRVEQYQNLATH